MRAVIGALVMHTNRATTVQFGNQRNSHFQSISQLHSGNVAHKKENRIMTRITIKRERKESVDTENLS